MLKIVIKGKPVPKKRPRTVRSGGRTRTYTPKVTKDAEERIRMIAWAEMKKQGIGIITGDVSAEICFYGANPAADIDNLLKTVLDGLNGTAFADDKQVTRLVVSKDPSEDPRTTIKVSEGKNDIR